MGSDFFDDWEKNFDKMERGIRWGFILILIANFIVWGVFIWAIIELVQWVTSK